ncbi:hypothetical protein [Novosphingobium colocasiae]|nr:hypothetical protein [Novosphingobium colocasiae]
MKRWPTRKQWIFGIWLCVMFFAVAGYSIRSLAQAFVVVAVVAAFALIELKTDRPRRSFYRLAAASGVLLFLFLSFSGQNTQALAVLSWLGIAVLGSIVTVHYERTDTGDATEPH